MKNRKEMIPRLVVLAVKPLVPPILWTLGALCHMPGFVVAISPNLTRDALQTAPNLKLKMKTDIDQPGVESDT